MAMPFTLLDILHKVQNVQLTSEPIGIPINHHHNSHVVVTSITMPTITNHIIRVGRGHPVEFPCNEQGCPELDQVVQILIEPHLECLLGWGIHHITQQHAASKGILPVKQESSLYSPNLDYVFSLL